MKLCGGGEDLQIAAWSRFLCMTCRLTSGVSKI